MLHKIKFFLIKYFHFLKGDIILSRRNNLDLIRDAKDLIEQALGKNFSGSGQKFIDIMNVKKMNDYLNYDFIEFNPNTNNEHVLGAIYYDKNKIYVNSKIDKEEQLFIFCHEVCHGYLHSKNNVPDHIDYSIKTGIYDEKESEANVMAYEILMPEAVFNKKYTEFSHQIDKLAVFFGVSTYRVVKRLSFLMKHDRIA